MIQKYLIYFNSTKCSTEEITNCVPNNTTRQNNFGLFDLNTYRELSTYRSIAFRVPTNFLRVQIRS